MKYLLDTHAFLWWVADDSQLSSTAKEIIADPDNIVILDKDETITK
jgi:PIN domain nuclease of toxin-antitoxin system